MATFVLGMGLTFCGCKKTPQKVEEVTTTQEQSETTQTTQEQAEEVTVPDVDGDIIYIYSYDDALENQLKYFYEKYPEYEKRVQFVNADMGATSKEYQALVRSEMKIKPVSHGKEENAEEQEIEQEPEHKYPSIVANDSVMASVFMQDNYSVPISSVGILEEELNEMYPYTLNMARFNGEIKGLTWYTTPGCFLYRADIAQSVLGDDSPEFVQKQIKSWDAFKDVAEQMKEAGYKILSGPDEITYAMIQDKNVPWIVDNALHIDASAKRCVAFSKVFLKEEYTGETAITDEVRENSFDSDVFGWFVYPDELRLGINTQLHEGEFRICEGPNAYHWGSTYLTISPNCPDKELAALVIKTLCMDEDVLRKEAKEYHEVVNHQTIVKEYQGKNKGMKLLGNQSVWGIYEQVLCDIQAENVTPYDGRFDSWLRELSVAYNAGEIESRSDVIEQFKDKVSDAYNYIRIK